MFFFTYLAILILVPIGLPLWIPLMHIVPKVLLGAAGHDPRHSLRPLHPWVWIGLTFVALVGACASGALVIMSLPGALQSTGQKIPILDLLPLILLCLLGFLALGGVMAGIVRYGLIARDWPRALISLGILTLPLLGLLIGAQQARLRETPEAWRSLGAPPEPAAHVVGVDMDRLAVETSSGSIYTCCTLDNQWQPGDRQPEVYQRLLGQPAIEEDHWVCPDCRHQYNNIYDRAAAIPAPPLHLTQPTWFSVQASYYGIYTFGGAGIAADGQVWEWRRYGDFLENDPPWPALTPAMRGRVAQAGRWGTCIGGLGSVALTLVLWLRRARADFHTVKEA